jgi:hypothetical protein
MIRGKVRREAHWDDRLGRNAHRNTRLRAGPILVTLRPIRLGRFTVAA